MTQDELQLLTQLAYKIEQTPAVQKDPQADELIRTRIASRPDAVYLLTQTVMIQNLALEQAKKQIQDLQSRAPQGAPQSGGSFLPQQPQQSQAQGYGQPQYPQAPPPPQQGFFGSGGGGGSSFLRSAGTTAAGIAAGALAFEGIRHLIGGSEGGGFGGFGGGHHASGFLGGDDALGGNAHETVVNNYYGSEESSSSDDDLVDDADLDTDDDTDSGDSYSDDSGSDDA